MFHSGSGKTRRKRIDGNVERHLRFGNFAAAHRRLATCVCSTRPVVQRGVRSRVTGRRSFREARVGQVRVRRFSPVRGFGVSHVTRCVCPRPCHVGKQRNGWGHATSESLQVIGHTAALLTHACNGRVTGQAQDEPLQCRGSRIARLVGKPSIDIRNRIGPHRHNAT